MMGLLLLPLSHVNGEGTEELRPDYDPPDSAAAYLTIRPNSMGSWGADSINGLYIRISDTGETIYYGFGYATNGSFKLNEDLSDKYYNDDSVLVNDVCDSVKYRIIDPEGNVVDTGMVPLSGKGFIGDSSREAYERACKGPKELVGDSGYNALKYNPEKTGDYSIAFNNLKSGGKTMFQLFDITVGSESDKPIPGRLWAYNWRLLTYGEGQDPEDIDPYEGKMYTYSDDRIVTEIEFDDFRPWEFTIYCNSFGVDTGGTVVENRRSANSSVVIPEYKMFLQPPDSTEFPTGDITCVKALSTVHQCNKDDYYINLETAGNKDGYANVFLDINGNGKYDPDQRDVKFDAVRVEKNKTNSVKWDGLDDKGNPIPYNDSVAVYAYMIAGITHLPMRDVERCGGLNIRLIRPDTTGCGNSLDSVKMYWDDTKIGGSSELNGCLDFCRSWEMNEVINNTWWYIKNEEKRTLTHFVPRDTALLIELDSSTSREGYYRDGDSVPINIFYRKDQFSAAQLLDTVQIHSADTSRYTLHYTGYDSSSVNKYTGFLQLYSTLNNKQHDSIHHLNFYVDIQTQYCTRFEQIQRLGGLKAKAAGTELSCYESGDGAIEIYDVDGGSGSYHYSVKEGQWHSNRMFERLSSDTFMIRVRDKNYPDHILRVDTVFLDQPPPVRSKISHNGKLIKDPIGLCPGETKKITADSSLNTDSLVWTLPDDTRIPGSSSIVVDTAGDYSLTAYDQYGCRDSMSVAVTSYLAPETTFQTPNSSSDKDTAYTGEQISYSVITEEHHVYKWDISPHGSITGDPTTPEVEVEWGDTETENAFLTVNNRDTLSGCLSTDTFYVHLKHVPPLQIDQMNVLSHATCSGSKDGKIQFMVGGGEGKVTIRIEQANTLYYDTNVQHTPALIETNNLDSGVYTVIVTNKGIVPSIDSSFRIEVADKPYRIYSEELICEGDVAELSILNAGEAHVDWIDGSGDTVSDGKQFETAVPGHYTAHIVYSSSCVMQETFTLDAPDTIVMGTEIVREPFCDEFCNSIIDVHLQKGEIMDLTWHNSRNEEGTLNIQNPRLKGYCAGKYVFTAMNANGCKARDTVYPDYKRDDCLDLPSAFSPNNDGVNDRWRLSALKEMFPKVEVYIYDRHGRKVFHSKKGYPDPWDGIFKGKLLPIDSYHYLIFLHKAGYDPLTGQVSIVY